MSNDVFFPPPSPLPSASRPAQAAAGAGLSTGTPRDEQRHSPPRQLRRRHTLLRGPYVADNTPALTPTHEVFLIFLTQI